jgi:hypothetical protein
MSEHTRREFLGVTLPASVMLGAGLTALQPSLTFGAEPQPSQAVGQAVRSYGATKYGIELDGIQAGWLDSVDGGDATSDVVLDNLQRKHLAGVKYEDIVLTCGTGMSKSFYDWIKTTIEKGRVPKNGAIVAFDYNGRQVSRLEWSNGLITEVGFPACDASSKDAARITVKITPVATRMVSAQSAVGSGMAMQKRWSPANFRAQISGCPTACSHVSMIDAIVLKVASASNVGPTRSYQASGLRLEIPNLTLTIPESEAAELYKWHEDFVIKGGSSNAANEKSGTLEYLTPDMRSSLFTLSFAGLGIFRLAPEKMEVGAQAIPRVKAEMYCDSLGFAYSSLA